MKALVALVMAGALSGCAEYGAKILTDLDATHDAIVGFVEDRHQSRRDIRSECKKLLDACVQDFRDVGDLGGAATVLSAAYAPPLTFEIVNNAIDDSEGDEINAFTEAFVCVAVAEHCTPEEPN